MATESLFWFDVVDVAAPSFHVSTSFILFLFFSLHIYNISIWTQRRTRYIMINVWRCTFLSYCVVVADLYVFYYVFVLLLSTFDGFHVVHSKRSFTKVKVDFGFLFHFRTLDLMCHEWTVVCRVMRKRERETLICRYGCVYLLPIDKCIISIYNNVSLVPVCIRVRASISSKPRDQLKHF